MAQDLASHVLKAKVDSSTEESEESSNGSVDKDSIGKYLALLMKKFNRFQKGGCYKKYDSKKGSSSARDLKKCTSLKCKEVEHYITNCHLLREQCKKKKKQEGER